MFHKKIFSRMFSVLFIFIFAVAAVGPAYAAPAAVINPNLLWNTFIGGASMDAAHDMVIDANGNIYAVGYSEGAWGSPLRAFGAGHEGFIAKFSPSGALIWSTFLGSAGGADRINGIALDGSGNIYVTGSSNATWGSPLNALNSTSNQADAFVARLDSSGNIIWNTFIDVTGEDDIDYGLDLAVDGNGNIYTAGDVYVSGGAVHQGFAFKLNSSGGLEWTKLFDSYPVDGAGDIAVDGNQNVYFLGSSVSTWGTPIHPHGGGLDAYIAKLNPADGAVIWNTFLGGNGYNQGIAMVIDSVGNFYVTGESSTTWGTPIRPYTSSTADAYVAKVNSSGGLVWNTFLGGSDYDLGLGIDVDSSGNVYVSGLSLGSWGSPLRAYGDGGDGFAAKLNSSGILVLNTFLGSSSNGAPGGGDDASEIAIGEDGNLYVIGASGVTWGTPILPYVDGADVFVAKLDINYPTVVSSVPANSSPTNAASVDFTVTFSEPVTGVTLDDFALSTTGVTGASITGLAGSEKVYTVTVNTGSGSGTIRLNVADNDSIVDGNANPLGDTGTGNGNFTTGQAYTIDRVGPSAVSSVRVNQNPSHASSVDFAVTFTEPVIATTGDFILSTTGVTGASVSSVSSAGNVLTVRVNTGSGNGTIRLDIDDDDSITDLASNPLGGVGNDNGDFAAGETYTIKMTPVLAAPVLRSPRTKVVLNDTQPTFQWTKITGAKDYEIQFDDNNDFSSLDGNSSTGITSTSHTVGSTFADGEYFWRVRAYNNNNQPGKWSAVRSFTIDTAAPAAPDLFSPANASSTTRRAVTFIWDQSASAVLYQFMYDNDSNCSSPIYSRTTNKTSIRPPAIPTGTYYWCVSAKDAAGNWSGVQITPFTFTIAP